MNNITLEQFKNLPEYQNYLQNNPSTGVLKVQVFTADQAIPIPNTQVYITKLIDNYNVLFFEGVTDSSGIIDNIILPAPSGDFNLDDFVTPSYTTYQLVASNDELKQIKQYQISMFGDVKVLQYVKMSDGGDSNGS